MEPVNAMDASARAGKAREETPALPGDRVEWQTRTP